MLSQRQPAPGCVPIRITQSVRSGSAQLDVGGAPQQRRRSRAHFGASRGLHRERGGPGARERGLCSVGVCARVASRARRTLSARTRPVFGGSLRAGCIASEEDPVRANAACVRRKFARGLHRERGGPGARERGLCSAGVCAWVALREEDQLRANAGRAWQEVARERGPGSAGGPPIDSDFAGVLRSSDSDGLVGLALLRRRFLA